MRGHHQAGFLFSLLLLLLTANNVLSQVNEETTRINEETAQISEETTRGLTTIDELLIQNETQQAWEILEKTPEGDLTPDDRLWQMARVQYEMGRGAKKKEALAIFQKAEKYARAAIKENADNAEGYKWLAVTLGAQAKFSDTKAQVRISRRVKENIEKAIVLDPDDDISYLILSRWHYKNSALGGIARSFVKVLYGGLPKASIGESEKLLLQAIKLHDRIAHRYNLAKVYARMERMEDAKAQLKMALLLPVTFPEETKEKRKAGEKLQKWQQ
jgi:tetratricopeptide (TPR) repeat protein